MGINRVVQFQFKSDVTNDAIEKVQNRHTESLPFFMAYKVGPRFHPRSWR